MRPINPHAGDRSPADAVTFYTRPPWRPGTAGPVLSATLDGLADALALADAEALAGDCDDAEAPPEAADPDRWFAPPVSVTAPELAAFAAWRSLSLYHAPEALRRWRAVFPAPAGVDPLAELVAADDAAWAAPVSPLPPGV